MRPYRQPRRAMGEESRLRIDESKFRTVVYLCVDRVDDLGNLVRVPMGTGFFVGVPMVEGVAAYAVTARHIIERSQQETIFVRWNTADGFEDAPTSKKSDWFISEEADVAAIRARRPPGDASVDISAIHPTQFITSTYRFHGPPVTKEAIDAGVAPMVEAGDEIFFVGLFEQQAGRRQNLPVARFGNIARMPIEPMTLERFPEPALETFECFAYLAETRSWGGHSGSPTFWPHPITYRRELLGVPGGFFDEPHFMQGFLGLVSAHFDIDKEAEITGDILGTIRTGLNSGMAVITPAEYIRRLLMRDDVEEERDKNRPRREANQTPTMDSLNVEDSEFERFEDLTRKLVHTPKNEVDAKRKEGS
jgi:hypothetical protein